MTFLVAWAVCLFRFRLALRRRGLALLSEWDRAGTDWKRRLQDDGAAFDQLMRRQDDPTTERWRKATIGIAALFLANLAAPVVLQALR
jgi:hypothetical protein